MDSATFEVKPYPEMWADLDIAGALGAAIYAGR